VNIDEFKNILIDIEDANMENPKRVKDLKYNQDEKMEDTLKIFL